VERVSVGSAFVVCLPTVPRFGSGKEAAGVLEISGYVIRRRSGTL